MVINGSQISFHAPPINVDLFGKFGRQIYYRSNLEHVAGVLSPANGGTGNTSFIDNQIVVYSDGKLISSGIDKTTLDNITTGSVIGVKGDKETKYRTGNVNLTAEDIGALSVDGISESSSTIVDYGNATNLIQIGWQGDSLTADIFKKFAAYTVDSDNKVKIKDIDIETVRNLLKLNNFSASNGLTRLYTGDLNDIDYNSIFNVDNSVTNSPISTWGWGFVITLVHCNISTYASQIWIGMTRNSLYHRYKLGGSWGSWKEIPTTDQVPTGGGIEFQIVDGKLQYRYDTGVWG